MNDEHGIALGQVAKGKGSEPVTAKEGKECSHYFMTKTVLSSICAFEKRYLYLETIYLLELILLENQPTSQRQHRTKKTGEPRLQRNQLPLHFSHKHEGRWTWGYCLITLGRGAVSAIVGWSELIS